MRKLYDAVSTNCPTDGQLYAGYIDGQWPNLGAMRQKFPNKIYVSIAVSPLHDAQVLDIETGDATPADAPYWYARQLARGVIPSLYCNASTVGEVDFHMQNAGYRTWQWWDANYDNNPTLPAQVGGAVPVAKQYATGNYDSSVVVDFWPGIDAPIDDNLILYLIGGPLSLTLNDQDAHNAAARLLYISFLGREPTAADQSFWASQISQKGLDFCIGAVFDSPEAVKLRQRRGW